MCDMDTTSNNLFYKSFNWSVICLLFLFISYVKSRWSGKEQSQNNREASYQILLIESLA